MRASPLRRTFNPVFGLFVAMASLLLGFVAHASAVTNPNLPPACGTKVILVLDESGSINSTAGAETAVRSAANAFAAGLADTGSQLAVVEFGSSAKRVFNYTPVTSGASGTLATQFQPYFNGTATSPADVYDSPSQTGQWTNWDDALEEVKLINSAGGVAPLVVFVTDGDPTAYNLDAAGEPGGVATNVSSTGQALTRAVAEADAVKTQGSHILAVGVGAALNNAASLGRLGQIAGPDTVTSAAALDLATTDVLAIADFSNLPAALRAVVTQLCQTSVTLNKKVDNGAGPVAGGAGWQFTANVSTAAGTYAWQLPTAGAPGPKVGSTAADSAVTFQWKPSVATTSTVSLAETQQAGYLLQSVTCQVTSASNPTPQALPVTLNGLQFAMTLGPTDIVTCDVLNKKINPAFTVTKTVDQPVVLSGTAVNWTVTVTNTGDVPLNGVTVADPVAPGCAIAAPGVGLAVGEVKTITCSSTITADTTNVATVGAKDPQGTALAPKAASASVDMIAPAFTVTKTANASTVLAGTTVTWTVTVTNTGDVPLTGMTVTDAVAPGCAVAAPGETLAVGGVRTITCTSVVNADTTNVATVSANDPLGNQITHSAQATVTIIAPALSITKSVDKATVLAGTTVTWTVTVTNTGDVALANVTVSDPAAPACGTGDAPIQTLAAGASKVFTCTSVITANTTNVATATGIDQLENTVTAGPAQASVTVINPAITVVKSVDKAQVASGTQVTYTIAVTNSGDVDLAGVNVSDPTVPACDKAVGNLAKGQTVTYACTATIQRDTVNTVTATGTDPLGNPVPPSTSSATVKVLPPVVIAGATNTTLAIDKTGPANAKAGAVIVYRVKVTNTGTVDALNVVLRDVIPNSMFLAGKSGGVKLVKGQVVIEVGTLKAGETKTYTLKFRIDRRAAGLRTNVATASASNAATVRDTVRTRVARITGQIRIPSVTG